MSCKGSLQELGFIGFRLTLSWGSLEGLLQGIGSVPKAAVGPLEVSLPFGNLGWRMLTHIGFRI